MNNIEVNTEDVFFYKSERSVKHNGIVEEVGARYVKVRIVQSSACASCKIANHCTTSEMKVKTIDVYGVDDAEKYIKIFTFLSKDEIEKLTAEHQEAPHLRALQKKLAEEITVMVHSREDFENAVKASGILFGNASADDLKQLDSKTFLDVFDGVPQAEITKADLEAGLDIVTVLNEKSGFMKSNGEARRSLTENSISVNREKVQEGFTLSTTDLINNEFVLLQKGKKNYFVLRFV